MVEGIVVPERRLVGPGDTIQQAIFELIVAHAGDGPSRPPVAT